MRKQILKSLMVIGLVAASTTVAATQALFTDSVTVRNNTFSTGNAKLKLYYDNTYGTCVHDGTELYTPSVSEEGAIVECTTVSDEKVALNKDASAVAASDMTSANHWWDDISSPFDFTNIYPGWRTYSDTDTSHNLVDDSATVNDGDGRIITIGNAGSTVLNHIYLKVESEAQATDEGYEPLDSNSSSICSGAGDDVDPLTDDDWVNTCAKSYDTSLLDQIGVRIDVAQYNGASSSEVYHGTMGALITASSAGNGYEITGLTLDPGDFARLKFNFDLPITADNSVADKVIDYVLTVTGTN